MANAIVKAQRKRHPQAANDNKDQAEHQRPKKTAPQSTTSCVDTVAITAFATAAAIAAVSATKTKTTPHVAPPSPILLPPTQTKQQNDLKKGASIVLVICVEYFKRSTCITYHSCRE